MLSLISLQQLKTVVFIGMLLMVTVVPVALFIPVFALVDKTRTDVFSATANDGYINVDGAGSVSYNTVWTTSDGTVNEGIEISVGQAYYSFPPPSYSIFRGFLFFNTSTINVRSDIKAVILSLKTYPSTPPTRLFNLTLQNGTAGYPHQPLQTGDYNKSHYANNGGALNVSSWVSSGWNNLTLNSNGRAWVNKSGMTNLTLRSSDDINGVAPTGSNQIVVFYANYGGTSNAPKLYVTYTPDVILISMSASKTQCLVDEFVTISWSVRTQKDNLTISFLINITRNGELFLSQSNASSVQDKFGSPYFAQYSVGGIKDQTYSLIDFSSNSVMVEWTPSMGTGGSGMAVSITNETAGLVVTPQIATIGLWGLGLSMGLVFIGGVVAQVSKRKVHRKPRGLKEKGRSPLGTTGKGSKSPSGFNGKRRR